MEERLGGNQAHEKYRQGWKCSAIMEGGESLLDGEKIKQKVYLCLKDENNEYYNDNMLIYVALHELAHVLCDEIGHACYIPIGHGSKLCLEKKQVINKLKRNYDLLIYILMNDNHTYKCY